jgi:hypothetical protein
MVERYGLLWWTTRGFAFLDAQDLNAMLDASKYADLVLLLIDGSFGFEMETFEFLNLLQVPPRPAGPLNPGLCSQPFSGAHAADCQAILRRRRTASPMYEP